MSVRWRSFILGFVAALDGDLYRFKHRQPASKCDFPKDITRESTGLALYCPDESKLPAGVTADLAKASASANAVIYPLHDVSTALSVNLQAPPAYRL